MTLIFKHSVLAQLKQTKETNETWTNDHFLNQEQDVKDQMKLKHFNKNYAGPNSILLSEKTD